jgi:plasmid stabilization system protein ParE
MGGRSVAWTARAKSEFREAALYIAQDNPEAADRWIEAVDQRLLHAAEVPYAGRQIPEWEREDLREVILGRFRLMYRVTAESIQILRVAEGHRRFPDDS